jgi:ATP-dependent DNA ligase
VRLYSRNANDWTVRLAAIAAAAELAYGDTGTNEAGEMPCRPTASHWGCPYITRRSRLRPAGERSSLASSVPSLSGFAALKRFSTSAIYSSWLSVPS